ncbi:tetratricopeptide repeat protein [Tahibacter sp. UC22_41]|uniref:tetratricopeptide repeat protein n=1 Tax=Tahibacter sp. UC22_41 TaxID=3350178 RepID=UPI0036DD5A4C
MRPLLALLLCLAGIAAQAEPPSSEALNDRARSLYQEGRYDEAAATLREALALVEKDYGPDDPEVARSLNNLALIYKAQQRYDDAEPLYRRAVVIADRKLGEDDPDRMKSAGDLARLYVAAGKYAAAEPLYLRVIAWQRRHVGPQYGDVADTEGALASVYAKLGRTEDADRLARRSFASVAAPARAQGLVPQPADAYGDAQKSAAVRFDLARRHLDGIGDHCVAGEHGEEFRFSLRSWQTDNLDASLPADRVLATIPAAQRQTLERQLDTNRRDPDGPNDALCDLYSRGLRNGSVDYAKTDADAARILRAIYASDETMRIAKRNADLATGCIKQHYSAGRRDFTPVRRYCDCQTAAITANADDAQIDAWLASLPDTAPKAGTTDSKALGTTLQQAWVGKALKAAQRCPGAPR